MKTFIIRSCMFINKCMFTWWNSPAVNTSVMLCLKWLYLMLYFSMTYILPSRQTAQQRTADESKCRCNQRKHSEQYRTHPLLFNPFTLIFLLSFHFTSSVPFLPFFFIPSFFPPCFPSFFVSFCSYFLRFVNLRNHRNAISPLLKCGWMMDCFCNHDFTSCVRLMWRVSWWCLTQVFMVSYF